MGSATLNAQSNLGEARLLRIEPKEPSGISPLVEGGAPAKKWLISYSVGAAYTDLDSGGHAWNAPFQVDVSNGLYTFTAQSDGYAIISDGSDASGFSDILIQVRRKLWTSDTANQVFSASTGATIPIGGDIGSTRTKERVTASYAFDAAESLRVSVSGSLRRSESAAAANRNPYSQVVATQAIYNLGNSKDVFIQYVAAHPNGGDWSSTVVIGHDFPISKTLGGSISLARGLNSGSEDTAIEFDISW